MPSKSKLARITDCWRTHREIDARLKRCGPNEAGKLRSEGSENWKKLTDLLDSLLKTG